MNLPPQKIGYFSLTTMVAANAIPMYGVVAADWDGLAVIVLYMLETVIIGIFHALRMLFFNISGNKTKTGFLPKWGIVIFFLVHYNFFVFVQSTIFFSIAASQSQLINDNLSVIFNFSHFVKEPYLISIYAFLVSQLAYTGREVFMTHSYEKLSLDKYMFLPYTRIFIQQFVIILGGFVYLFTGSVQGVFVMLILFKTGAEYLGMRYGEQWITSEKFNKKVE